jgi:hypothetical protein
MARCVQRIALYLSLTWFSILITIEPLAKLPAEYGPRNLFARDRVCFGIVVVAFATNLVDFPWRQAHQTCRCRGLRVILSPAGRDYVTRRINCSAASARMPNIKWQSTLS